MEATKNTRQDIFIHDGTILVFSKKSKNKSWQLVRPKNMPIKMFFISFLNVSTIFFEGMTLYCLRFQNDQAFSLFHKFFFKVILKTNG